MPQLNDINEKSQEQIAKIRSYASNAKGFMLLAGNNGTGKSFVAEAIYQMHTHLKLPHSDIDRAFFITQADLNEKWLDYKNQFGGAKQFSEDLKKTPLLVIDDLGTRPPTDAFIDFLYAILDYRWRLRESLGTIITTNMNSKVMREKFGDAIVSRVSSGTCIRLEGRDRRFQEF